MFTRATGIKQAITRPQPMKIQTTSSLHLLLFGLISSIATVALLSRALLSHFFGSYRSSVLITTTTTLSKRYTSTVVLDGLGHPLSATRFPAPALKSSILPIRSPPNRGRPKHPRCRAEVANHRSPSLITVYRTLASASQTQLSCPALRIQPLRTTLTSTPLNQSRRTNPVDYHGSRSASRSSKPSAALRSSSPCCSSSLAAA